MANPPAESGSDLLGGLIKDNCYTFILLELIGFFRTHALISNELDVKPYAPASTLNWLGLPVPLPGRRQRLGLVDVRLEKQAVQLSTQLVAALYTYSIFTYIHMLICISNYFSAQILLCCSGFIAWFSIGPGTIHVSQSMFWDLYTLSAGGEKFGERWHVMAGAWIRSEALLLLDLFS